jgi:hypothetical protein
MSEDKSRAKYKCPENLKKFIDVVNMVPPKQNMRKMRQVLLTNHIQFYTAIERLPAPDLAIHAQNLSKILEICLKDLPEDFHRYIKKKGEQYASHYLGREDYECYFLQASLLEYEDFCQLREDLRQFTNYFTNLRKTVYMSHGVGGMYGIHGQLIELPIAHSRYELTMEENKIIVVPVGLSAALDGVLGDRVRSCEVCNRIFWADRKDKVTCSTKCRNIYKQREARKRKKPDEIKSKPLTHEIKSKHLTDEIKSKPLADGIKSKSLNDEIKSKHLADGIKSKSQNDGIKSKPLAVKIRT